VRQRPYTVVLLDECEKADPDVLNLFYQVFDKGMLSDGEGRLVAALGANRPAEVARLRHQPDEEHLSARNRFRGIVRDVRIEGLLAQVEIDVTEPARVVAIITRDAAEDLELTPGVAATAIVKATSVMVER